MQALKEINRKHDEAFKETNSRQDKCKSHYDVDMNCEQLYVSHFFDEIENNESPIKFNATKCLDYQGMKDQVTHVQHFKMAMAHMSLTRYKRDAIICKLFATTLCHSAQKWFNKLVLHTIASFSQFPKLFIINYASNKPIRKESNHLFSIIQGNRESIEEYMRRHIEEKLEISDFPNSITIEAFR